MSIHSEAGIPRPAMILPTRLSITKLPDCDRQVIAHAITEAAGQPLRDYYYDKKNNEACAEFNSIEAAWRVVYKFRHLINGLEILATYPETQPTTQSNQPPVEQKPAPVDSSEKQRLSAEVPATPRSNPIFVQPKLSDLAAALGARIHAPALPRLTAEALPTTWSKPTHAPPKRINLSAASKARVVTEVESMGTNLTPEAHLFKEKTSNIAASPTTPESTTSLNINFASLRDRFKLHEDKQLQQTRNKNKNTVTESSSQQTNRQLPTDDPVQPHTLVDTSSARDPCATPDPGIEPIDGNKHMTAEPNIKDITLTTSTKPTDLQKDITLHHPLEPINTLAHTVTNDNAEPTDPGLPSSEVPEPVVLKEPSVTSNPALALSPSVQAVYPAIRVSRDMETCDAPCSCWLPDGGLLITDMENRRLKRLNSAFDVVAHMELPGWPWAVCYNAARRGAAVSLPYEKEIQFVSLEGAGLSLSRKIKTNYECFGVCCRQDELWWMGRENGNERLRGVYIMDWKRGERQGKKIVPRDKAGKMKVHWPLHLTVNEAGDLLYVATDTIGLLVLQRNGTLVTVIEDLARTFSVCLGDANCAFVCGWEKGSEHATVVQYDSEGGRVKELVTDEQLRGEPTSVGYNGTTLAVTLYNRDYVAVFHLK